MPKILTFLLLILIAFSSYSQYKVSSYKAKADEAISNYFAPYLISKIKCTDIAIYGLDRSIIYFSDYDEQIKNKIEKLSKIIFDYSYYSKSLNYIFTFEITVERNKKIKPDSSLFDAIPNCIAKNIHCNFLTKDSAIKLAIKDSILYPNNIEADLYKHYKNDNYFWFVMGSPKVKKGNRRSAAKRSGPKQEKIINAITGEIIPHKEYFNQ